MTDLPALKTRLRHLCIELNALYASLKTAADQDHHAAILAECRRTAAIKETVRRQVVFHPAYPAG